MRISAKVRGFLKALLLYCRSSNPGPVTPGLASGGILYRLDDMNIEREEHKLYQVALLYLLGFSSSRERSLISSRSFRSECHKP